MSYPFMSIWINGRNVSIENIIRAKAAPRTSFEESTFTFIREWFTDQDKFTLQTSGSTGDPKNISVSRAQMIASAKLTEQTLQLQKFYNALICIDTKYIGGKMMLVRSFTTGMKILSLDPCANPLHKIPVDLCVNFAAFVPYQVKNMLGSKHPHLLNDLDTAIIGGAPLDDKTIEQLGAYLCKCYAAYGMTETLSHIALGSLNGKASQDYFETLPGISIKTDKRGCLVVDAPYLSEEVITNDIVEVLSPKQFRWLGRWDNVINTAGVKVLPEKVEASLDKIFKSRNIVNRFFIHGISDEKLGSKIVLVIEGDQAIRPAIEAAVSDLQPEGSPYEIPRAIIIVPSFITTDSGKVNRSKTVEAAEPVFSVRK